MTQPEIVTPRFLHLNVQATVERPAVSIRVAHDQHSGTYTNTAVSVESPMLPVTSTRIAKLRLGVLRRDALRASLEEANPALAKVPAVKTFFKGTVGRAVAARVRLEPTSEHLEAAATVYRLAKLVGDFPVLSVGRVFSLNRGDAARWVAAAKKSGDLS